MSYRMTDDSVTVPGIGHPEYSGKTVTARGEARRKRKGLEPGRIDQKSNVSSGRPVNGKSTERDVSSVRPLKPIRKDMPTLI